eukprot:scaffold6776_cov124-Cylindrotheca_fusiformis.AAC.6
MTTAMSSSNPFDDSFDTGPVDTSLRVASNPFDDNPVLSNSNVNINPFASTDSAGEDEEITTLDDDLAVPSGAPVEASWQYLGDLPYRKVPIYNHVRWGDDGENNEVLNYGLSAFPKAALQRHPDMLNPNELRELLSSSTITKVVGCPYGGPVAAVTLPIVGQTSWFSQTEIRIMTNAGRQLAKIDFPFPEMMDRGTYSPSDIMEIGFTARTALVIVLKDSLCLTFDLGGDPLLPPFHLLPKTGSDGQGTELIHATVFEGGAAVLSSSKHSAIVEFLDEHDDPTYFSTALSGARKILPDTQLSLEAFGKGDGMPSFCGLVSAFPTAAFASEHFFSYAAIAVLPRTRTASRHPEVFLSTTDNSVVVVNAATAEMKDLDCRSQISSPIVEMTFAPNGRFLACFTESSTLTVISTTFETKVLDFDTSEGSSETPLEMKWCGEDR